MSNRAWIAAGVIAMFIGCRTTGHPEPSRTEARSSLDEAAAPGSPPPGDGGSVVMPQDAAFEAVDCPPGTVWTCPDEHNCTCGNGTGVYAAEGGFAGITVKMAWDGPTEQTIMITHFINNTSGPDGPNVTFAYGYFVQSKNQWQWTPLGIGQVDSADYVSQSNPQYNLPVIAIQETDTVPIWLLRTPGGIRFSVTDQQLLALKLHISFAALGSVVSKTVILDFDKTGPNATHPHEYNMRWTNPDILSASPQQYCHGPNQQPNDMLVFQQGIDVDPSTGSVTRPNTNLNPNPANVVTVSCSLGAPAIVYSWGYPYQGLDTDPETFYFDAGIHMKRASYCGDSRYYTKTPTLIKISDTKPAHSDILNLLNNPPGVEAWWSRSGAVCVNSENIRHLSMIPADIALMTCGNQPYKIGQSLQNCTFVCKNKPLPRCLPKLLQHPPWPQYLVDGPKLLNQP